ncbi:unnamed protein product [Musa textilis]
MKIWTYWMKNMIAQRMKYHLFPPTILIEEILICRIGVLYPCSQLHQGFLVMISIIFKLSFHVAEAIDDPGAGTCVSFELVVFMFILEVDYILDLTLIPQFLQIIYVRCRFFTVLVASNVCAKTVLSLPFLTASLLYLYFEDKIGLNARGRSQPAFLMATDVLGDPTASLL